MMRRVLVVGMVAFGAAPLAALGLALADLYLTGHSLPSIGGEVITLPALGIALSPAGILLLAAAAGAGWLAWWVTGRESRAP